MKPTYLSINEAAELTGLNAMKIRRDVKRLLSENALQNEYVKQNVKQPIVTLDQTVKPYKTLILRAWLIDTYKVNEEVALQSVKRVKQNVKRVKQSVKQDVKQVETPPEPTPNVEFYERIIAAKDETISELKTQVQTKDIQILELIKSKEHSDILLQTALNKSQLNAPQPSEPQPQTDAPPLLRYVVVALLTLFAAAVGYVVAKG
ncbi:MAG: hypothetical protein FMNOHCHN_03025 [Ignavibacteriaceae bacterium]|nr:hypothetical protein [Ignavibacteriaceae bacterium]